MRVTIDGAVLDVPKGQTILQAARTAGIYIPTLCYHEKVGAAGNCRICIVEVEGQQVLKTACNTEVAENMTVRTDTPIVRETQRIIANLILASGRHDCLACEQNGMCELQDVCYFLGIERPSVQFDIPDEEVDVSSEFICVDRSKCISCGRCVAGCNETVVNEVISTSARGFDTRIAFDFDLPMGESTCVQCGECLQLCPVGAIIDKRAVGQGRPWELDTVETICPYCGVGCRLNLHINRKTNRIVRVTGVEDAETNRGMTCLKGRFGFDFVHDPKRLTTPLIRKDGKLEPATWDEAIALVASEFKKVKTEHGPGAFVAMASAKVTNEENYMFQKFVRREVGTNNVDHCARLCHSSTVAGLAASFGSGAMTNNIAGIKEANVILVIGSDTTAAHPVLAAYMKQGIREGRTKLIVIDPKKIDLADLAEIYVAQRPGSDVAVLNGIMQVIIKNGWEDKEFIAERCENFEEFKAEVMKDDYSPENVERISGVPADTLVQIAELYGKAETAGLYYAMGITQHTTGRDNVMSTANIQMLCGNMGKPGGGVNPLRGQSNVQGACDMGGLPNVYPAYQKVADPAAKAKFEAAWGVELSDKVGITITEMIDGAYDGSVKAMYIMGENPMLSDPDQTHVIKAFENCPFVVVQDMFLTETAQYATVVLPAASFAEKTGHFTNTERRIQRVNQAIEPLPGIRQDWEIIRDIACAMGSEWNYTCVQDITKEINELAPSYGGITWERVGRQGLQWPCPTTEHPGTPILHVGKFARGKGFMRPIPFIEPNELPDDEYPLILTTGRVLQHFHTGTMSRCTEGLNNLAGPMVMISVHDAEALGIGNSEKVIVKSRRGEIEVPAFVTKRISKGVVYVPFHYAEAPANRLTNPAIDPMAKIPEYKVCAAKVMKIT
ncbi:MAG: formate dehydrogenase subunit alpha [Candidatus Cloacimonetes bacterium]|nr:formate dehydrogenase subunit alpha [Candidatus Cloacimonadota bacterium]